MANYKHLIASIILDEQYRKSLITYVFIFAQFLSEHRLDYWNLVILELWKVQLISLLVNYNHKYAV